MRSDTSTRSQSGRVTKWLVSGPPFVFLLVFFVLPAAIMVLLAVALSPMTRMARAGGPIQASLSWWHSSANWAFSERNPYPG
jgi:hypothetical protein